jgi:hypothetical protein
MKVGKETRICKLAEFALIALEGYLGLEVLMIAYFTAVILTL